MGVYEEVFGFQTGDEAQRGGEVETDDNVFITPGRDSEGAGWAGTRVCGLAYWRSITRGMVADVCPDEEAEHGW